MHFFLHVILYIFFSYDVIKLCNLATRWQCLQCDQFRRWKCFYCFNTVIAAVNMEKILFFSHHQYVNITKTISDMNKKKLLTVETEGMSQTYPSVIPHSSVHLMCSVYSTWKTFKQFPAVSMTYPHHNMECKVQIFIHGVIVWWQMYESPSHTVALTSFCI